MLGLSSDPQFPKSPNPQIPKSSNPQILQIFPTIRPRPASTGDRSTRTRRSEEHTSELQSQSNLVCRLLLEKKKTYTDIVVTVIELRRLSITYYSSYIHLVVTVRAITPLQYTPPCISTLCAQPCLRWSCIIV